MIKRGSPWTIAPLLVALLLAARPAVAQDLDALLKEAVDLYERGRDDEALVKLRAIIDADPSSADAARLKSAVDFRTWARQMIKGEQHAAVIMALFDRSLPAERAHAKDDAAIKALLEKVDSSPDFAERQKALFQLSADHGEYVVPHLAHRLASDSTEVRAATMEWLRRLGPQAVMPLIQTLELGNELQTANALTVLGQIGDRRAAPYLAACATAPAGASEMVRGAATRACAAMGGGGGDAVRMMLELAESYYRRDTAVVDPFRATYVAWSTADGKLVANEVPRELYPYKLAEEVVYDILDRDAANEDARTLLASTLLAQSEVARGSSEESLKPLGHTGELVLALGPEVLDRAVRKAIADGRPEVASAGVRALGSLMDSDSFSGQNALTLALGAPFKEVRFAAATAITRIGPRAGFAGQEQVVAALAEALGGGGAIKTCVVIDDNGETRNRIVSDLNARGWFAYGAPSGAQGLAAVRNYPVEDLVVVRYDVRDVASSEILRELRADARTQEKAVVLLSEAKDTAAAKSAYDGKVQGFIECPPVADAYEPGLRESVKIADEARERALGMAVEAAETLAHLDPRGALMPTGSAVSALVGTLKGDDRVRGPAIRALGRIGDPAAAAPLFELFGDSSASESIRGATAVALARIARSAGSAPNEFLAALGTALAGEGSPEYLGMLGQAAGLVPVDSATRARLLGALRPRIKVDLVQ